MLLPVGSEDFRKIIDNQNLSIIDKTLFIKEVLDDIAEVMVITRPRRFGKTLNLSMLYYFLSSEIDKNLSRRLFKNLQISQCGKNYLQHQGKYPVVSITLKEINADSYDAAISCFHELLSELYTSYRYLLSSQKLADQHKRDFENIMKKEANEAALMFSLKRFTEYLTLHHGVKPWLLIDEYDAPIQAAYAKDYYDKMTGFMRGLLGAALKTNPYLHRGVITGILRIAKESFFSGLNNLQVYSLLDNEYSQHFGFTEQEVETILEQANLSSKADEIKSWYNGYRIGETVVYNPWSIASCIKKRGLMQPYWVNAGENQLIKELLKNSSSSFKEQFELLMQGQSTTCMINEKMVFQYLTNPTAVWSLLLMSGYLKPLSPAPIAPRALCELTIPNNEIRELYCEIIEQWLSNGLGELWLYKFINALVTGNVDEFRAGLNNIILQITSYHDMAKEPEAFYHGLLLGFIARLHNNGYEVQSNKESGLGRHDIMLVPDDKTKLGIIIEIKNCKSDPEKNNKNQNLMKLAKEALQQIDEKKYPEKLKQCGLSNILKIGIGFSGKEFELVSSTSQT